jgi:hypothetical protein
MVNTGMRLFRLDFTICVSFMLLCSPLNIPIAAGHHTK